MPDKFLNKYRISSVRLAKWDYSSNGSYFITICTAHRQHFFGEIINSEMELSQIGEYANQCWLNIPNHFPYFYLDEFIVMPNHLHGIVLIGKPYKDHDNRFGVETGHVETGHALSLHAATSKQPHLRFRNQGKNTISSMVGSFKSAVTKYCNENKLSFQWQGRFHDHIIRSRDEFHRIKNYIISNPANWKDADFIPNERRRFSVLAGGNIGLNVFIEDCHTRKRQSDARELD
jgi:REP element-mobilizing transposase RayT